MCQFSGASTSIHITVAPVSSATWMVWPVPPTSARVVPSQIAITKSDCSTITRLASATRSEISASKTCALRRSLRVRELGQQQFADGRIAIGQLEQSRLRRKLLDALHAFARRCVHRVQLLRHRRTATHWPRVTLAGCALIAAFSVSPKGSGAISSQPRASAASAAIWSAPSASSECSRVGASSMPGALASSATAASIRSRMRRQRRLDARAARGEQRVVMAMAGHTDAEAGFQWHSNSSPIAGWMCDPLR